MITSFRSPEKPERRLNSHLNALIVTRASRDLTASYHQPSCPSLLCRPGNGRQLIALSIPLLRHHHRARRLRQHHHIPSILNVKPVYSQVPVLGIVSTFTIRAMARRIGSGENCILSIFLIPKFRANYQVFIPCLGIYLHLCPMWKSTLTSPTPTSFVATRLVTYPQVMPRFSIQTAKRRTMIRKTKSASKRCPGLRSSGYLRSGANGRTILYLFSLSLRIISATQCLPRLAQSHQVLTDDSPLNLQDSP